jgi:hypothetical protein
MPSASQGACVDVAGTGLEGTFCAAACATEADCPTGWSCGTAVGLSGVSSPRCLPPGRVCTCGYGSQGSSTTCAPLPGKSANCLGKRSCGDAGLSACSVPATATETCNGVDDDCNGQTDDLPGSACDDGNPCTDDACGGGQCVHLANAVGCSDGDACTKDDVCAANVCHGKAIACSDGNPCTDDACDPAIGCTMVANTVACNDGEPCTGPDACSQGACVGQAVTCDDNNACTIDSCVAGQGCDHTFSSQPCDDGNACTGGDACHLGACVGDLLDCEDGFGCTIDQCEVGKGCVSSPSTDPACGIQGLPYAVTFTCADPKLAAWLLQSDGAGSDGVGWKVEPAAADLPVEASSCVLHAGKGQTLQCGSKQAQIVANATSPVIDATAVVNGAPLQVRFESAGTWTLPAQALVQASPDGLDWTTVGIVPPSGKVWGKVQLSLPAQVGGSFHLRLQFHATNCSATGTGWSVRNLAVLVDTCAAGTSGCSADATCSIDTAGVAVCGCKAGFTGNGTTCVDVDECLGNTAGCDPHAACTNVAGGAMCACSKGWQGDGKSCTDVNECTAGTAGCDTHAACANSPGGFLCTCNKGYAGDGKTCADVDECTLGTAGCDAHAACANSAGGFLCTCGTGWKGDGKTCTDVDECAAGTAGCDSHATCANSPGAFTCACNKGYAGDGKTCKLVTQPNCATVKSVDPSAVSGKYTIDADGPIGPAQPVQAWCDMTTAGGPWTWARIDDGSLAGNQDTYAAMCAKYGMEIVVPRNQAHANAIRVQNGGVVPNLINVFPNSNGATGLSNWHGTCQGKTCGFWVSTTNNANCQGFEPNGDNNTAYRLYSYSSNACDYGQWNDANNTLAVTGWVLCSTNDK